MEEFDAYSILTIGKALNFENETEDDSIRSFINDPFFFTLTASQFLSFVIEKYNEKETLDDPVTQEIPTSPSLKGVPLDIELGKTLNIKSNSSLVQRDKLVFLLKNNK